MVVIEWWFWFIIIMILLSRTNKKKHLNIIKRKKGGRKRKMPTELIKDFIGKMCTITVFNEFAVKGKIIAEEEDWICEARRYYIGIVGKYGIQVQNLLKKMAVWEIQRICPLHGPVLTENIEYYVNLYHIWSSYQPEEEGIFIAYTSIYGNTKKAAMLLEKTLKEKGCPKVVVKDLIRCDRSKAVADAFRYSKIVLASTTYNNEIFPAMREFIDYLTERNFSNRVVAFMENGSWAPVVAKAMREKFEKSKGLRFADTTVKITSALNEESRAQIEQLAEELQSMGK